MTVKTLKKQLAAAIAMVLVSVIALSSSTYAWFAANTQVSATGMNVKAQAEGGLIIANTNDANSQWVTSVTALNSVTDGLTLLPTSTNDLVNWYHNVSNEFNNANAVTQAYADLTTSLAVASGVGYIDSDASGTYTSADDKYYHVNDFYIKSSNTAMTSTLYVNKIAISGSASSAALDKSLRVAIKIGDFVQIYAPFDGATLTYNVAGTTSTTALTAKNQVVNTPVTGITEIPAFTGTPITASVYMYFEGEDANCKSSNISATLDNLQLTITFGTTTLPTS